MSYVRSKMINGYGPYYYEVRSVREGDKVRQIHIRYLGRNPGGNQTNTSGDHANVAPNTSPQDARQARSPSNTSNETVEARDEITQSAKDTQDILAKNEAQRAIIDDTDAPESRKEWSSATD